MVTALIVIIIAVLLARLDIRNKTNKNYGLISAFVLLTAFASIRYNWGNDYSSYLNMFFYVNSISDVNLSSFYVEPGWVAINRLFYPIGFFGMIIVLTCFEYIIIYRFITKYLERRYYWFAVLIFTMSFALMITGVSMMRQFLAQCICLLAFENIINKRLLVAILLIYVATLFHTSAMIIFPVCFAGYCYKVINNKKLAIILSSVLVILYVFGEVLLGGILDIVMQSRDEFSRYDVYFGEVEDLGVIKVIRTLYDIIFIAFVFMIGRKLHQRDRLILLLIYLISFFFDAFANLVPMIGRISFYFEMIGIVVLPIIFSSVKNKIWRTLIPLSYVVRITYGFISSFYNDVWHKAFFEYHTIFEASHWM